MNKIFKSPLLDMKEAMDIREIFASKRKKEKLIQVNGLMDSGQIHFIESISDDFKNKIIITFSEQKAKEIAEDYKLYDRCVHYYPPKDFMFYQADIHGNFLVRQRQRVIKGIIEKQGITIVTTIDGLLDMVMPISHIEENIINIEVGDILNLEEAAQRLTKLGYERLPQVESEGQFAIRGSILDVYPLTEDVPIRIDLWDDEIDSIKYFDVESQRSIENINAVSIYPATEYILSRDELKEGYDKIKKEADKYYETLRKQMKTEEAHRIKKTVEELKEQIELMGSNGGIDAYIHYFFEDTVSFIEYFDREDTLFVVDEPNRISERADAIQKEFTESMVHRTLKGYVLPSQASLFVPVKNIYASLSVRKTLLMNVLEQKVRDFSAKYNYTVSQRNINPYNNSFELLIKDLEKYKKQGYKVIILAGGATKGRRMVEDIRGYGIDTFYTDDFDRELAGGEIAITSGGVKKGFEYPGIKYAVISQNDIFGTVRKKKKKKKYSGNHIQSFSDLNIGDYVVHENHGLGIYRGIEKIEVDKVAKDYIKIEYAGGGNLYILATQLDMIQKYADADAKKPKLNKLGTKEWNNTKTRVRGAVKDIAADLVKLYAKRQEKKGFSFLPDTVWQSEFEELFPFDETEDQLSAIEDTKRDMESSKIMDRLVCGDVGYGKTEIAIRAAFKAVQSGKQVVFLVPTTILAGQHYNNFCQRMKDFPVRIDLLSRFRTPAQQKQTIAAVKSGEVDILIGTHRVLSKDIKFKDLGLLIVDEEQRFGVTHKEKIKQMKEDVDVLTLTATPIPRTLHMSLVGIRDMSVLEEPPVDRQPIQTYVMEYDEEMVREAISRELSRGGQVYYVYNRVNNIEDIALTVSKLVPEANVAYAHGQMSERKLEQIMYDFVNGDIDVLVATTIIETGIDISNVNTIIIHDADNMGLSQLYQLRGRVGRSNRTAYAFLMYKRDKLLKEVAEKRLQAIREFTELGSGFKIAMRDLEIRGAGNILGAEQHGHMEAVGYDLYCKMLNEAVMLMKGETTENEDFETSVDVEVDAYIPATYIRNEYQKLGIYKKISNISTEDEFDDMQDELLDRFGDIPKAVYNLMNVALVKAKAHDIYVTELKGNKREIRLSLLRSAKINPAGIPALVEKYKRRLRFVPEAEPYFIYTSNTDMKDMGTIKEVVLPLLDDIKTLKED